MRRIIIAFASVILLLGFCLPARGDVLLFWDGRRIEGEIIDETETRIKIRLRFGIQSFDRSKVKRIERAATAMDRYLQKKRAAETARDWLRLAEWCADHDLIPESREAYRRVLAFDSNHPRARRALGYTWTGDAWVRSDRPRPDGGEQQPDTTPPEEEKTSATGTSSRNTSSVDSKTDEGFQIDQEALRAQKKLARSAEERLHLRFQVFENSDLLVHTTQPTSSRQFRRFLQDLKKLYLTERRIFAVEPEAAIWPGKLQIFFFRAKNEFDDFATQIDRVPGAVNSGGYFLEGSQEGVFHICMYNLDVGTLAHELSHAFMARYNESGIRTMPWLNEGTAEYMRYRVIRELRGREGRHKYAVKLMQIRNDSRLGLESMMEKRSIRGTEGWAYAISWSLVDFMIDEGGRKFVDFLKAIKEPGSSRTWRPPSVEKQKKAIEEAFGVSAEQFERLWHRHIRTTY